MHLLHTWNRVDPTSSDVNSLDVAPLHQRTFEEKTVTSAKNGLHSYFEP